MYYGVYYCHHNNMEEQFETKVFDTEKEMNAHMKDKDALIAIQFKATSKENFLSRVDEELQKRF